MKSSDKLEGIVWYWQQIYIIKRVNSHSIYNRVVFLQNKKRLHLTWKNQVFNRVSGQGRNAFRDFWWKWALVENPKKLFGKEWLGVPVNRQSQSRTRREPKEITLRQDSKCMSKDVQHTSIEYTEYQKSLYQLTNVTIIKPILRHSRTTFCCFDTLYHLILKN